MSHSARRLLHGAAVCLLPCAVAAFVAGSSWDAGLFPWHPKQADLEVYLRAAHALLSAGGDPYHLPGSLPFLYPPFAAILAVGLTWPPHGLVLLGWAVSIGLCVVAILHRLGLSGWRLSLIAAAVIKIVQPVNETVAFGQLGAFLVGLVFLDLVDGPRAIGVPRRWPLRRWTGGRWLPAGALVGVATAIKLTPGLFFLYLLAIRRFAAAAAALAATLICTLLAVAVAPADSLAYWSRLLQGKTGLGSSIIYLFNQSVLGASTRIFGYAPLGLGIGLVGSAAVAIFGVLVSVRWHRRGDEAFAVTLCGLATLLASPVSWSHHFVWIVPLGYLLAVRKGLPPVFRVLGWLFVGWAATTPFTFLPSGDDRELGYHWWQELFASTEPVLGLVVLVAAWIVVTDAENDQEVCHGRTGRTSPMIDR